MDKPSLLVLGCEFKSWAVWERCGEKITRLFERATQQRLPVVIFTASVGPVCKKASFR